MRALALCPLLLALAASTKARPTTARPDAGADAGSPADAGPDRELLENLELLQDYDLLRDLDLVAPAARDGGADGDDEAP